MEELGTVCSFWESSQWLLGSF